MADGQPARQFIVAHADSTLVYEIPLGFTAFSAIGVRKDELDTEGHWAYKVLIDGKQVYESEPLVTYPNREVKITVSLPRGAKEIELFVDSLGDGAFDRSVWAYPQFTR